MKTITDRIGNDTIDIYVPQVSVSRTKAMELYCQKKEDAEKGSECLCSI